MKRIDKFVTNILPQNSALCAALRTAYFILKWPALVAFILALTFLVKYSALAFAMLAYTAIFFYTKDTSQEEFDRLLNQISPFTAVLTSFVTAVLIYHFVPLHPDYYYSDIMAANFAIAVSSLIGLVLGVGVTKLFLLFREKPRQFTIGTVTCAMVFFSVQYSAGCALALFILALAWPVLSANYRCTGFFIAAGASPLSYWLYWNTNTMGEKHFDGIAVPVWNIIVGGDCLAACLVIFCLIRSIPFVLNWVKLKYENSLVVCKHR